LIKKAMPEKMVRDRLCDLAPERLAVDLFARVCPDTRQVVLWDVSSPLVVLGDLPGDGGALVYDDQDLVRGQASRRDRRKEYCCHDKCQRQGFHRGVTG
jgi:hypothetical protein